MPSIPDIPGKRLVTDTTKRARVLVGAVAAGALAAGGLVAKRVLAHAGHGGDEGAPTAEASPTPTPVTEKPAPKPKPPKPKGANPAVEPGDHSHDKEPHHALNNPVADPDETEYPDPFEQREDPRDPVDPDGAPFGEEPHPQVGSESTSEPPPALDPEVGDLAKPPKRDKLDD